MFKIILINGYINSIFDKTFLNSVFIRTYIFYFLILSDPKTFTIMIIIMFYSSKCFYVIFFFCF